ncbi:hypothetical protein V8E36_001098 [Tilletia maclaganii]
MSAPMAKRTVSFIRRRAPTRSNLDNDSDDVRAQARAESRDRTAQETHGYGAAEHHQHSDPLLRRLRLVDGKGQPANLREFFRGVKVVGFYFSSQWAGQPLKEYHKVRGARVDCAQDDVARRQVEFSRRHTSEFEVIYVSVDVDEQ